MRSYVVLLRGINVGGKNKVPMEELRKYLEELGFSNVSTYIASGNVLLQSEQGAAAISKTIEEMLPRKFKLDSSIIRVLTLTLEQLKSIVDNKPVGFGEEPEKYYCDAIFLMGIETEQALKVFDPRDGVDTIWPGVGVIYSQRLGAERVRSKLNKIVGTPAYQSMTIRNWNTTTKLLGLLKGLDTTIKSA